MCFEEILVAKDPLNAIYIICCTLYLLLLHKDSAGV
jgi:hypothetical protein